jgi:hypothetical protein
MGVAVERVELFEIQNEPKAIHLHVTLFLPNQCCVSDHLLYWVCNRTRRRSRALAQIERGGHGSRLAIIWLVYHHGLSWEC